jgi:hypothetical protein
MTGAAKAEGNGNGFVTAKVRLFPETRSPNPRNPKPEIPQTETFILKPKLLIPETVNPLPNSAHAFRVNLFKLRISHNVLIKWFKKVNPPTKSSTYCFHYS